MLVFTLSYIKNLANAFVLGDTLRKHSPAIEFSIGLVDDASNLPSESLPHKILTIKELALEGFADWQKKYNENELLPNCKPLFFRHLLRNHREVIYIDCTSEIYQPINFLFKEFDQHDILLTPQLLLANRHPKENQAMNSGIYHAGLIGVKNTPNTQNFINWWESHTSEKGYIDLCKGMNADQYCLELVPTLFDKVKILKQVGLNIGEWNLPERKEVIAENKVIIFNHKNLLPSKSYQDLLLKYQPLKLDKIKISYGIPIKKLNSMESKMVAFLRWIVEKIDNFFDLF